MKVELRIDRLRALHSGEATAEPYLWPVFFKVDRELFAEVVADRTGPGTDASFHAPGGEHGNLPEMTSGDEVDVDLSWTTELDHGDLVRRGEAMVGILAILMEEDVSPSDATVKKTYASFVESWKKRIRREVAKRIQETPSPGPYGFDYRDAYEKAVTKGQFDPIEVEKHMTKTLPKIYGRGLFDADDFIGAMVWCVASSEIAEPGAAFTTTKLWTPTTGSEEGSWELDVSVHRRD